MLFLAFLTVMIINGRLNDTISDLHSVGEASSSAITILGKQNLYPCTLVPATTRIHGMVSASPVAVVVSIRIIKYTNNKKITQFSINVFDSACVLYIIVVTLIFKE